MRLLAVTFNPARDATYFLQTLERGGLNRVVRQRAAPGGKGNNVARILAARGHDVTTTGFLAGRTGASIDTDLRAAGIHTAFTWLTDGETRSCHTLIEIESGTITEVLEAGPAITEVAAEQFLADLPARLDGIDVVVTSGSLPPGLTGPFLTRFMKIARARCPFVAIDSSGDGLRVTIEGGPNLIKPNEHELATLMGSDSSTTEMVRFASTQLIGGAMQADGTVLLSLGAKGAILIARDGIWRAIPSALSVVNPVGCGDALLAGFLDGRADDLSLDRALARGVAFGSAAALREVAGEVDCDDIRRIQDEVEVVPWTG